MDRRLVLSRKKLETVELHIGSDVVRVTVIKCTPHQARIAFEAPEHVRIVRAEIANKS